MASLLGEVLFEIRGQGPAPSKDYYIISVTKTEVIWRWWKISLRSEFKNAKPGELRESHQDYLLDSRLQDQVRVVFGRGTVWYTQALCRGEYDYLERLPDPLLLRILAHLELEDVVTLGRTSHRFRQLCGSEEFWEQAVRCRCGPVSSPVSSLARELGWRNVFFTSKLQLQKLLSRKKKAAQKNRRPQSPDHSPGLSPSPRPSPSPGLSPSPSPRPSPSPQMHLYMEPGEDQGSQEVESEAGAGDGLSPLDPDYNSDTSPGLD